MSCGPLVYFATVVPAYKNVVITASMSTPEWLGYYDVAVNHFLSISDLEEACRMVFVDHWGMFRGYEYTRWDTFCEGGIFSEPVANAWADEAWNVDNLDISKGDV
jgi:hypothetical protein